jgi:hypothetical protein
MVLLKSKTLLALTGMMALAAPAAAQNYDYLSRSDSISLSGGNATSSNLAIQTPTPWPPYVNNTRIPGNGQRGVNIMDLYQERPSDIQLPPETGSTSTGVTTLK